MPARNIKMTTLIPLIIILIAEFIGDFLLQSRETALSKSKDIRYLIKHLCQIAWALAIGFAFTGLNVFAALGFILCYCLIHGIQDWYIWNGYKWLVHKRIKEDAEEQADKGFNTQASVPYVIENKLKRYVKERDYAEDKAFYDTIGLDRLLHIITIIILYGVFFL